jgi:hypothetical protein
VLFSFVTVPAGIALTTLQVIGHPSGWAYTALALVVAGTTAGLIASRTGRLAWRAIRRRLR